MPKENPADNPAPSVQRHNYLSAESVEGASDNGTLRSLCVRQICPINQMSMQFEPSDESVAITVCELFGFRQTTHSGGQSIFIVLPRPGENPDSRHTGYVRYSFDNSGKNGVDVVVPPKHSRKPQ